MDSKVTLPQKNASQLSSKTPSLHAHPLLFFANTRFASPNSRSVLVDKIGCFIEDMIEKCNFKHWLEDPPETLFCSKIEYVSHTTFHIVPFILCLMKLMHAEHTIDNILIGMMIYLDRYFHYHKNDWPHRENIKLLLLCSAWLATIILEDDEVDREAWVRFSGKSNDALKALEVQFLLDMHWNLYFTETLYGKVCDVIYAHQTKEDDLDDEPRGLMLI